MYELSLWIYWPFSLLLRLTLLFQQYKTSLMLKPSSVLVSKHGTFFSRGPSCQSNCALSQLLGLRPQASYFLLRDLAVELHFGWFCLKISAHILATRNKYVLGSWIACSQNWYFHFTTLSKYKVLLKKRWVSQPSSVAHTTTWLCFLKILLLSQLLFCHSAPLSDLHHYTKWSL